MTDARQFGYFLFGGRFKKEIVVVNLRGVSMDISYYEKSYVLSLRGSFVSRGNVSPKRDLADGGIPIIERMGFSGYVSN